ncbi:hypothetical protein EJB05_57312, partial [Eragrostis curvula]
MAAAGSDDVPILQAENLISNVKSVNYRSLSFSSYHPSPSHTLDLICRTFLSIIGGVVAGIWGFTGLMGFVFYFVIMMVASIGLLAKSKFSVQTYFDSWSRISIEGVFGGLMLNARVMSVVLRAVLDVQHTPSKTQLHDESRRQNPSLATMASSVLRSGHRILLRSHQRHRLSSAFSTAAAEELVDVRKLPTDYDPSTFDPSSPSRPPPSDRVWRLVDEVSSLTLAESAALSSLLLRRLDIPSAPPIAILNSAAGLGGGGAAASAGPAGEKAAAAAEKTVFELRLEAFDSASKIKVIKEIRSFTDLGLKEAKELVEKAPAVIKGGVSKEDAEAIVERMKAVGAKVVMG